jgi:hypothetical protein
LIFELKLSLFKATQGEIVRRRTFVLKRHNELVELSVLSLKLKQTYLTGSDVIHESNLTELDPKRKGLEACC